MVAEMRASAALGWTPAPLVERTVALLTALGLPARLDRAELAAAWPYVGTDKKRVRDAVRLPVVTAAGAAHVERVALEALRGAVLGTSPHR
jgi:3-dehydroquinate synthetase